MIFLLTLILIFLWRMSAFTHGGAYKVILNDVELSKTLAPWWGYEYNTLCCKWVRHFYLFPCLLVIYHFCWSDVIFQILMLVSSIGYYRIYAVNLNDKCIWILDSLTPRSADKGEQMKRYFHTLKQIEENIIKVVRLKHSIMKWSTGIITSHIIFLLVWGKLGNHIPLQTVMFMFA
jgi:hypothetical protein